MVIICHGFGANKSQLFFRAIADSLASRGIASIRFDFHGHGKADGTLNGITVSKEVTDAKCVYDYVREVPYVSTIGMDVSRPSLSLQSLQILQFEKVLLSLPPKSVLNL